MKLVSLLLITVVLCSYHEVRGSKILGVFWTPSKSHHILGSALLQALAKKGHNVTLLTPFIDDVNIPTFKQIKLTGIEGALAAATAQDLNILQKTKIFMSYLEVTTKRFWENEAIKDLVNSRDHYDVIISLNFFNDGILALNHHLGAPTIIFHPAASRGTNKYVANPYLPYTDNMMDSTNSFGYFIGNLVTIFWMCSMAVNDAFIMEPLQQRITRNYLPTSPPISELRKNISLLMVNAHTSLETPRPYVPNMIPIGGFYAQTNKKLPDIYQKYLDSAKDGAILFSFGTNMKIAEVEKEKLAAILEGLRKISPIKVVFKSEVDLKDAPENVMVVKWLPQNDILAHPNIRAFITHGGLGGNTEAVYHGVPMIGTPLFADQKTNIENAVKAGYAISLPYEDINQETVDHALKEILNNPSYTKNAKKRSSLLRNQPINPLDKAIWWVEHIIEHKGGEHLRNQGMDLEWYQLYMVDIILFYFVVIILMLTSFIITSRWIIRKLIFKVTKKTKKE